MLKNYLFLFNHKFYHSTLNIARLEMLLFCADKIKKDSELRNALLSIKMTREIVIPTTTTKSL